ncbi:hypothetical protein C6501_05355 [Candidatus Poribacteria bacterium]|nr:MAG: hypothetical protein C6501_05355 [Candidatus Poribacteria bacterium]
MKKFFVFAILVLFLTVSSLWAAKLRINGDNSWVGFINGEKVAEGNNWQVATVTEFDMPDGHAIIAVYVHDAEPGGAGRGGALFDVILDDGTYIPSNDTWKADAGAPLAERNDGWETIDFDDSSWENATQLDQFGSGIWAGGAGAMRNILKDPDSTAYWIWAGPNDVEDDVYFRKIVGDLSTPVEPNGKITTTWGALKAAR